MQSQATSRTDLKEACAQASRAFIAANGIEKLSLREIARELDVSHQAPNRHFESKDHLLAAVIARCFRDHLDERTLSGDPREELRAL